MMKRKMTASKIVPRTMVVVLIRRATTASVKIALKANILTPPRIPVKLIRVMKVLVEDTNARIIKDLSLARVKTPL